MAPGRTHDQTSENITHTDPVKRFQPSSTYRAVSLLRHSRLPWEEDKLGAVLLQPLHVGLQGLGRLVASPGIHGDSNSPGKLFVNASELERERNVSAPDISQRHCATAGGGSGHQPDKGSSAATVG